MQELLQALEDVRSKIADAHENHTTQVKVNDDLGVAIQQLKMELAEARGEIKALTDNNEDLKDRLEHAVQDATYFREKVGVATSAATDLAQKMVQIIQDVERKPPPMLSLDDIEERKPMPVPGIKMKLSATDMLMIAEAEDGATFFMGPPRDMHRSELRDYYRGKTGGIAPPGRRWKERPDILFKKVGDRVEFIEFVYPEDRKPAPFRPQEPALPEAPTIPAASAGDFNAHGQLADDGEPAPAWLSKPIVRGNGGTDDSVGRDGKV